MKKNILVAHIFCLMTMIIWGLSFVSIDFCLKVFRPMTLAFIRFALASIVMWVIFKQRGKIDKLEKKDYAKMAISGIIGISVYFYFENNGILHTDPSIASLLLATIPLFSLFGDVIIFKERLTLRKWMGIIVSLAGVVLIIGFKGGGQISIKGNIFMLGAVMAWVIYSIMTKPLTEKYSQTTIVYYQAVFGALALLPFTFFEKNDWSKVDLPVALNVLYLAIFCSIIGYIMYVYAVDGLGVSISSFYINLMPLVTVVGSYFILGTVIGRNVVIGGALVISSVFLISETKRGNVSQELKV